ncbi:MAG: acylphosphatase [Candidatus Eisenbacteria bacterium]|nr:acylphosphatase [Candidatus Eisenbacteria bacterium]
MREFRAIVFGRVQGVCFRAETVSTARRLGLRGYARNLPDGTVEVVAAGPEQALADLLGYLHHGPSMAKVERVEATWSNDSSLPQGFEVRR